MKRSWLVVAAVVLATAGLALASGGNKHKGHKAAKAGHVAKAGAAKVAPSPKAHAHKAKAGNAAARADRKAAKAAKVDRASHRAAKVSAHKAKHQPAKATVGHKAKPETLRVQGVNSRSIVDAPVQPSKAATATAVAKNQTPANLKSAQLAMSGERLIPLGNW